MKAVTIAAAHTKMSSPPWVLFASSGQKPASPPATRKKPASATYVGLSVRAAT